MLRNALPLSILLLLGCQSNDQPETTENETSITDTTTSEAQPQPDEPALTYGIDISKYQGDELDYLNVKQDTLSFVICKATEGNSYVDPDFAQNWQEVATKGLIRGAYHFYHSDDDPNTQAQHFANTLSGLAATDLAPVIDFEGGGIDKSQSVDDVQSGLLTMIKALEDLTGRKPIIYTNHSTGTKYLTDPSLAEYPLWIADYEGKPTPHQPSVWADQTWVLWQKTDSYDVGSTKNDFDVYNGTIDELKNFIQKY